MESALNDNTPDLTFSEDLRERITSNLKNHPTVTHERVDLRRAAVAVAVAPQENGQSGFILTRRSRNLQTHSHQYALPGGKIDVGETQEQTVLREVHEEIGIRAETNEILGYLDDYVTRSGFIITPIVLWIPDLQNLKPEPGEVDEIFIIGFDELFRPDSPRWVKIPESKKLVLQLPLRNRLIHAPTAALIYQVREIGIQGNLIRTDEIEEPVWAWR
ncbi:MAG: CoA pyrophosphatase [Actinomycetota bacterium]|nr:CoA pyrophosphatase [Actinomycetota bacterium]